MTAAVISSSNFKDKLNLILNLAKGASDTAITIMAERSHHVPIISEFLSSHKGVDSISVGNSTYYLIKEMRIEVKPVDLYI